jgi:hypothetical protein
VFRNDRHLRTAKASIGSIIDRQGNLVQKYRYVWLVPLDRRVGVSQVNLVIVRYLPHQTLTPGRVWSSLSITMMSPDLGRVILPASSIIAMRSILEGINLGSDDTMPGQGLESLITTVLDTLF